MTIDPQRIEQIKVIAWDIGQYRYGVAYTLRDGRKGIDPIGTKTEAERVAAEVLGSILVAKAARPDPLEQVWAILINPERSIRSIKFVAREHGFNDMAEFSRAFRERFGASPREVRRFARKGRGLIPA